MPKILIIDPNSELPGHVEGTLRAAEYGVTLHGTAEDAAEVCRLEGPDLVVVVSGSSQAIEVCRKLQTSGDLSDIPVIYLSGEDSEVDRVLALELGVFDFIVLPVSDRELLARVRNQIRRSHIVPRSVRVGPLELDAPGCRAKIHGRRVPLTQTEFRLLETMMKAPGTIFRREDLLAAIWNTARPVSLRTVDVYVLRLRQKLEADRGNPRLIRSVRGFGYGVEAEPVRDIPPAGGEIRPGPVAY